MDLKSAMKVSTSGLQAQALRMRVIAENLANQDSVSAVPGGQPYQRRVTTFKPEVDRETGAMSVKVDRIVGDRSAFGRVYRPGNPGADASGYVLTANVNGLIENADMKAAQRAYEANISAIEASRSLTTRTLDLLK